MIFGLIFFDITNFGRMKKSDLCSLQQLNILDCNKI
jgi:hypothetical protein